MAANLVPVAGAIEKQRCAAHNRQDGAAEANGPGADGETHDEYGAVSKENRERVAQTEVGRSDHAGDQVVGIEFGQPHHRGDNDGNANANERVEPTGEALAPRAAGWAESSKAMTATDADWPAFIAANTRLLPPPLVPEILLHLAEESLPIWRKTEDELGQMNVPPPYWAFAWAGGQALARFILDHPALLSGKRVLDLGAGSGLTAIAAMRAGAAWTLAADIDRMALAAVQLNARANGVTIETTAADLLADAPAADFGAVLVGDLFYERELAERVERFIVAAARQGASVLIGDPGRSYFPKGRFVRVGEYRVPVTRELEDAEIKNTAVWQIA